MKQLFLTVGYSMVLCLSGTHLAMAADKSTDQYQDPDSFPYEQRRDNVSPQSVLQWLKNGNERFASGNSRHGGYSVDSRPRIQVSKKNQYPLASVLSCIDSRNTPELVFDTAVGDLFTARVGANVIDEAILGSLEFASNVKVLVVLGHTDCEGVIAACNREKLPHMQDVLDYVRSSILSVNLEQYGPASCSNSNYVDELSHQNAYNGARRLLATSQILREKVKQGKLILVSAVYDVGNGKVTFDPIQ